MTTSLSDSGLQFADGSVSFNTLSLVSQARNLRAYLSTNGTSITFTADELVIASAVNGSFRRFTAYAQTLNISTTGAGGMDTGAAPTSGFVAIYAVAQAGGTASILGVNAATSTGSIYSGANMPAGYTFSALIAIIPTNATPQLLAGLVLDRTYSYQTVKSIFSAQTGATTLTLQSLATGVPVAARAVDLIHQYTVASAAFMVAYAADATGTGVQVAHALSDSSTRTQPSGMVSSAAGATFKNMPIITAQTTYWMTAGAGGTPEYLYVASYSF